MSMILGLGISLKGLIYTSAAPSSAVRSWLFSKENNISESNISSS